MALSPEQQDSLKARYDILGLDTVRKHIERSVQSGLASTDEIAFARSWVVAEEVKSARTLQFLKNVTAIAFLLLGGTLVGFLIF